MKKSIYKAYQLTLTCEYEEKKETHILHIGKLSICKTVQMLSKQKQKQYIKNGIIPEDAKLTYKIEKVELKR